MSVLKSNRKPSDVQFLATAREIELHIYQITKKFPKRFSYTLTAKLIELSMSVYNNLLAGNSVYPTNKREAETRKFYWIYANNSLQCLIAQASIAKDLVPEVSSNSWEQLGLLLAEEAKLIAAVKHSDTKRYKDLP